MLGSGADQPQPHPPMVGTTDPAAPGAMPGTGHPAVDAVVQAVTEAAATLPPGEQIDGYEAAHRTLRDILATIDQA